MSDQAASSTDSDPRPEPEADRVSGRTDLLPEEVAAGGVDDPDAMAEALLAESDARQLDAEDRDDPDDPQGATVEHRTSDQTVEPPN